MLEALVALFVFFATGLAWLAWNHPKAYDAISPYLVCIAFVAGALFYGLQIGYSGGVETLRKFLNPAGVVEAEKLLSRVNQRATLGMLFALASGMGMLLLGGLRFLPRGRD